MAVSVTPSTEARTRSGAWAWMIPVAADSTWTAAAPTTASGSTAQTSDGLGTVSIRQPATTTSPVATRARSLRPIRTSAGPASAPKPSTPVARPYAVPPPSHASSASGSSAIATAARTALTSATAPIAPRSSGPERSVASTPYDVSPAVRSGAGSTIPVTSAAAVATPVSDNSGTSDRSCGASSSPPSAGPTTKEATSTVTRRVVARAAPARPAAAGIAAARAG